MDEKSYFLNKSEVSFLANYLKNETLVEKIKESKKEEDYFHFQLTKPETENLLDELTYLFTEKGLKPNNEPNQIGLYIEALIDIFYKQIFYK